MCYNAIMKKSKKLAEGEKYPERTIEYSSLSQDFDGGDMRERKIDASYKYGRRGLLWRLASAFLYRCIAAPCAYLYTKIKFGERYIGKEKLKAARGMGCFIYGNHTQPIADAFTPNMIGYPRRTHVVISSKNFSLPVLGPALPMLGGVPTPTDISALRNFTSAIDSLVRQKKIIAIYPEAHLWPYCGFIRPFSDASFAYPVRCGAPSFSFTRVYKRKKRGGVRCEVYIDGPFYPDASLSPRAARARLADEIFTVMTERAALGDVKVIHYKPALPPCEGQSSGVSDGSTSTL